MDENEQNLVQEYLDSDPRKLSSEMRKKAAKVMGISLFEANKLIEKIGAGWEKIDPNSIPPVEE